MLTPSTQIIQLLSPFRAALTRPTFERMLRLMCGAILAPGARTVTACIRAIGEDEASDFANYHRVLSRAVWSPLALSRILLGLLVACFVAEGMPLVFVIDDTLERRRGKKVRYKSLFRDAVRSTKDQPVTSYGIRWVCMALLVNVPWCERLWALPVIVAPSLSFKRAVQLGKVHRSPLGWARVFLAKVRRWHPEREIVLVGDGGYASVELIADAQYREGAWADRPATIVTRLRLDASLYHAPSKQPAGKRGPKPKKGERQRSLQERARDGRTRWKTEQVAWYRGQQASIQYTTGEALWHTPGADPVPIRWLLVRYLDERTQTYSQPAALLCSDPSVEPMQILAWFLGRWSIEVTFEEMRACLGFETQRQWADKAILRTTPALFGLFSLVTLMAHRLYPKELPVQRASWYNKEQATFSDALRAVRAHLWSVEKYNVSPFEPEKVLIPIIMLRTLKRAAGCAA
jgi:hypothetical protein